MKDLLGSRAGVLVVAATGLLILLTGVLMALLWPSGEQRHRDKPVAGSKAVAEYRAEVVSVKRVECPSALQSGCVIAEAKILEGPERGKIATFDDASIGPNGGVELGNKVFVAKNGVVGESVDSGIQPYSITGYDRQLPLIALFVIFLVVVVLMGRWRGLLSLLGLGLSLLVVVTFMIPAILDGKQPLLVAVVGSVAVMVMTIMLAHGFGAQSLAAILGTAASLGVTVTLAVIFTDLAHIIGSSSEESMLLLAGRDNISLQGLVLAGMVIGALGVLDDVTVSQSSTVMALRKANPNLSVLALYRRSIAVGRDHVAATVNTLVLAYLGASLPIVLIFTVGDTSFGEAVNLEQVAIQIIATLVGSIGLITAVPVTTALAAVLARNLPVEVIGEGGHVHSH